MNRHIPLDGLAGLIQNYRYDAVSGFIVFLIALPLSVGIALAAGMPAFSGLVAAIVGGMLVSLLGGSHLTINGPAAGLIAVIAACIQLLGGDDPQAGIHYTLAASVVAGLLLALAGVFKMGRFTALFPMSAVHGMLASIGIIIVSKQIHVMLGVVPHGHEPLELLAEIPQSIARANPLVAGIGLLSVALMIAFSYSKNKLIKALPKPLLVVIIGALIADVYDFRHTGVYDFFGQKYSYGPHLLVQLPEDLLGAVMLPDFTPLWHQPINFVVAVAMIALITGLESLISSSAIEQIDPYKRPANMNRDLTAVGIGTAVSGALGGYPIIAEIVRSSANISNGARTRWSNFFHGLFMLLALALIPGLIQQIPLAALAGILCFVGYNLASPKELFHIYRIDRWQLVIFLATILSVLATDLLIGMAVGMVVKFIINLQAYPKLSAHFSWAVPIVQSERKISLQTGKAVTFTNIIGYKKRLESLPRRKKVEVNFSQAMFVDHTAMTHLMAFKQQYNLDGGNLHFTEMAHLKPWSHHPLAPRIHSHFAPEVGLGLSRRQQALSALAETLDYSFRFEVEMPDPSLKDFYSLKKLGIKYQENVISGLLHHETEIHIFDLAVAKSDAIFSQRSEVFTVLVIKNLSVKMPFFCLEKEHPIDFLGELAGFRDIDFKDYPNFSKRYLLWGRDAHAVRKLFSSQVLDYLDAHQTYGIESYKNRLLIHKNMELLSMLETRRLIEFALGIVPLLEASGAKIIPS